jgi:tRNA (mo5U34)-methyltransferase
MSTAPLTREIEKLGPWFHNLHLPDGTQTAPEHFLGDFPHYKWQEIAYHLPERLDGWKALDIGCNAGYYSFELAKRGAEVTAIDIDDRYLKQARWAANVLELEDQVEFRKAAVYDLAYESQQYDLIWFMGVLYHLRYPLLALDIIRKCSKGRMIFQTMTIPGEDVFPAAENYELEQREVMNNPGWPKMAFIEHRVANDPTNWWAPNHAGVEALLRSAGFSDIDRIAHEVYSCRASSMPVFGSDELYDALRLSQKTN